MIGSRVDARAGSLLAALEARQAGRYSPAAAASRTATKDASEESAASAVSDFDFANMTPKEMQGVAKKLFDAGEIDLTQLLMLQTAGVPLGRMGPQGEFVPLSADEKEGYLNREVDYSQIATGAVAFLEQSGGAADPKSGYQNWQDILSVLQQRQGTPGIDAFA